MIYLDNASTTKPSEAAKNAFLEACDNFANPSSLHALGLKAEKIVSSAKEEIAKKLEVGTENIYFTSGGTEANNMAILGYCHANHKMARHIITTKVEHPSVMSPFQKLEEEGFLVDFVGVDSDGRINMEEFSDALCGDTLFVSVMAANNETGTIMPIPEIKKIMKQKAPKAILHVDAVQGFGKIQLKPMLWGADMMSVSAHKIHGIKGTGALYSNTARLKPLLFGGGQQKDLRSGTENVPGIAAFGAAAALVDTDNSKILKTRMAIKKALEERIENITFNGSDEYQTGYVLNVSFIGIKAEILLHMLEAKGIYVSTGSACSSNKPMPSHVLNAMGKTAEEINGAIRISFDKPLDDNKIKIIADEISAGVKEIRKYIR